MEANQRRFDAAEYTVHGRFTRDQLVTDGERVYRIVTVGIAYHEDADSRLYGVATARPPKEWTATKFLRDTIKSVLCDGTHEPESRGATKKRRTGYIPNKISQELIWTDRPQGSVAWSPHTYLSVHGDCVRAVQPVPDDAPIVTWVQDPALVRKIKAAVLLCPNPFPIATTNITKREPIKPRAKRARRSKEQ
jgi:hypothetical protein